MVVSAQDSNEDTDSGNIENVDSIGNSQGFSLFEEIETSSSRRTATVDRPTRENRANASTPEFTLVGTTRIGNYYSAIIQHRDGDTLVVATDPDANTPIPGHSDYTIVDVGSGNASIRYPQSNPCIEFRDQGVSCNSAANIGALVLTKAEPLPSANAAALARQADASQTTAATEAAVEEAAAALGNPFEALRAAQNADGSGARTNNRSGNGRFSPRRIDADDVPPGMRVVSTPFGDRLVEQ